MIALTGQPLAGMGVLWGMADLQAGLDTGSLAPEEAATDVAGLFRARYPEMVRLADLLGADDPEDIAQEAFARLIRKYGSLRDRDAALAYVRASVCNLTRNRHRGLRLWDFPVPTSLLHVNRGKDVMLGYDAAGRVVWQMRFGSGG